MKKYTLILLTLISFTANSQIVNKFRDSTWFAKGVRFDSEIYLTKGASNGKVLTSNAFGCATWQNASGGVSQTLSISNDTLFISNGNSVVLPIYIQEDSATVTAFHVLNSLNTPPVSPAIGDIYLVGNSPTGVYVGHAKDVAEWDGSVWVFTDAVQGDFLHNTTTALTYIFRSGNWVQTTGIPALNNGNSISVGLKIGTNNLKSLTFETNNKSVSRFDSIGRFYVYDTALRKSNKFLQIDSSTGRLIASDILNPSSSSSLFPNGYEFISESRDFLPTDEGKLLVLAAGVTITMPSEFPFLANQIVGVNTLDSNCYYQDKAGSSVQIFGINNQPNEVVVLLSEPDFNSLLPISSSVIEGKTALKYLYDQSQNEQIITLGTVTFNDINAAPAISEISIPLNVIPSDYYAVLFFCEITAAFDFPSMGYVKAISGPFGDLTRDFTSIGKTVFSESSGFNLNGTLSANTINSIFNFDAGSGQVNPKNLTTGSATIKALIKKFPN